MSPTTPPLRTWSKPSKVSDVVDFHPIFCQPFEPLPLLENSVGIGLRFHPALWEPADFVRCGIEPVSGNSKRQSEYLAARLCARKALHGLTGEAFVPARASDGRPLWPQGMTGSITHGHGRAAALAGFSAHWQGLGLDLEPCLPAGRALRLAPGLLSDAEQAHLARLRSSKEQAFFVSLSFSLKESLFKALYPLCLQRFYCQHAEVIDYAQGKARLRLLLDLPGFPAQSLFDGAFFLQKKFLLTRVGIAGKPAQALPADSKRSFL